MKKEVYICPQCGCTDSKELIGLRYTPTARQCAKCNYMGIFPIIPNDKIKKFQKQIKKVSKENQKNA